MLTERRWNAQTVPYLLVGMFLSICCGYVVVALLGGGGEGLTEGQRRLLILVGNTLFVHGALLLMLTVFLRVNRLRWTEAFGWRNGPWQRVVGWSVATVAVVLPVAWTLSKLAAWAIQKAGGEARSQMAVQFIQQQPPWYEMTCLGVMTVLVAPLVEEALFRGILYPTVKQAGFPRAALYGTSLLFAVYHSNLMTLAPLFVLALALVAVYEATDNLWAPTLVHALFNAANFVVLAWQVDLDRYFKWMDHWLG